MEEKQQILLANQDGGTVTGAAPTFFVILKQPGNGKTDQGILVTNRDACTLSSRVSSPGKSKGKTCLPADCTVGRITVTLDNNSMWNEFHNRSTEMILTKQGRRMFPYCRYWITGLDSNLKYILVMDISPVDNHRYKWNGRWWEPSGKAEPHILGRVFIHPESPSTGHYWMHQPVSFYKLKLTNNTLDQEGHIILHSMHRYLPRLHLVPAEKATEVIQLNGPGVHTFTFPQTEFFAVTAYQNIQITQLKIDYNPFAKGFRDDGLSSKPQRDGKQRNSSDQEGNSIRLTEGEGSEIHSGDFDPVLRGHEASGLGLEKPPHNVKQDFLGFISTDSALEVPQLKHEISESLIANSFEDDSQIASPLNPNGNFNVVIKEEPLDGYDYELGECPEGVTVKQEETDEETDVYSNSDDDPILEKQLKRHNKVDNLEADHPSYKWLPSSPGVAKAKMSKLDAGKMPVVYLEPCAVTKSTVKISELPDTISTSRKDKSVLAELEYLPAYIENSSGTGFCLSKDSENSLRKHSSDLRMVQKYTLLKEPQWNYPDIFDSSSTERTNDSSKVSTGDSFLGKEDLGKKRTTVLKMTALPSKAVNTSQSASPNAPGKRGRPRKVRLSKAGRPPKNTGKSLTATKNIPVGPGNTVPDVKPDLEDVDGVLFVSFESKEALDIHAVDGTTEEPSSLPTTTTNDPGCRTKISQLEKELIEDLKSLRHKQVIHPALQEVGLKLNSVDPTMSIDLKYLGVQLPLAPATSFPFWNLTGTNPASPDAGFPFVSRTGKTNDFTKIKGWRGKFHSASSSRNEGGNAEASLKNRSAFCSDKLDEYLENEGKLMETSMGFSSNAPTSPVVYQLPTKSTSYVRTLDSVLKKQSTVSPSTSYSVKSHSVTTASRKTKSQNKQATLSGRTKSSYKSILPYPVSPKQKNTHVIPGDKITKNSLSTASDNQVTNFVVPAVDESAFPKQISLRQAQQQQLQQQGTRPLGLSKSQVKLMDLEDCALWEGKPRTYITEERADVSLTTLLTAQASLKTKPIHTIIRKRAPPCNNDFCRLGCVCSSLALEKRQPAHCRRPDCMFGCTCLKRKVVLVKGGSKTKHFHKKAAHRDSLFYDTLGEEARERGGVREDEEQLKEKKKRKKLEYTVCEAEPEQPVRHYPLWVKVEGEVDPEPVYIPTPSVMEPVRPLVSPQPDIPSTAVKGKSTGIKPARAYTPKPNPVIREEDKDPVYLYFESMMTCARVRVYERKKEEQRQLSPPVSPSLLFQQQSSRSSSPENRITKEPDSEQTLKQLICDLEDDSDKSQEKSWKSPCNEGESSSTSYVHQRSPGGPTKLIEIISDCNWEEDRNKILSILSQHINSNMPQSLKVGSFIIELASQRKCRGEKNPPVYSSRVKISMPSSQDQDDMAEKSGSETPDGPLSPGKMDDISPVQTDALDSVRERLHGGKGLPFYAGLSPAGKLVAYKRKPSSTTSGLIQVNGKSYPQAKLLLGQMGALHPANRLAAYITGRLRPSVLDLSTLSTVISKVASNAKVAASRKPRTLLPSTSNSKMASSGPATNRSGKNQKAFVPAKRPIAARPSPGGVFTQFVMSKVGALQQKIPGVRTPQPLTGPQKFSIRPSPVMVVTPVVSSEPVQVCSTVTAAATTSPQVFLENVPAVTSVTSTSDVGAKEATCSSGASAAGVVEISETNNTTPVTSTQSTATVNLIKTTGITTSAVASVALPKSLVASPTITLPVASTASTSVVMVTTAASSSMVTTPTSSLSSVPIILSGINGSPPVSQRPENSPQIPVTTPQISPNNVKRTGPRLLLIPVQQGSPTLRPAPNPQLQGQRMVLQPVRSPSGMNLFRHPNGQIVQLLPLHQIRGSNAQPSLQPVVFRNPGSVVGIRLPAPSKSSETPSSSTSSSAFSVNNYVDYMEDDEQVDVETIEELSEEINVAYKKTTVTHTQSFKQPCHSQISADEKAPEKSRKLPLISPKLKDDCWSDKPQKETEAFAYYRRTHTANERRRRGEMRDLFEKLKITLGLLHSSKVSKSLILTRAFSEIQGLTDQADKLIGQKNLLSRKRNILIRKVSSLSGKTEEVVLKKLEYIYAKQQALEAQKRKKKMGSDEFGVSPRISKQLEGSSTSSVDLGQMFLNNRRGKPLILSRKRDQATENALPSNTPHSSANLVMTPQGQLLTLKGPLFSGPVVAVSPALLDADLKPQGASSATAQSENDDLFMMPRIVNVTSLAAEDDLVDVGGNKYPHEVPDGKPLDHVRDVVGNEASSLKDADRTSSRGNHRDGRMARGPTQVFLANKDSGFPHVVDVSSMQAAQEFVPKKISGDVRGHRYKWKECELRGERLKSKESQFHKLKMKDLKDSSIEMELRKVASAIEDAALDPSELLTTMEDEDDTDETLASLLNEIAFLNQQLNDDSSLAELPGSMDTEFPENAHRAFISKLAPGNRSAFQGGHLGTGLKELPDVQEESESISPLLLHLEDDDFSENEKQLGDTASEPDVLKIVINSEIKDSLVPHRKSGDRRKSTSGLPAEPESVSSPPILHMKTGPDNSNTDTLWRPMPKLAPLGLKVANPPSDTDGQSLKVMPSLAPIAAKVGHKMNLIGNDQEGRENKVMPTLAPVVAKLGSSGVPSSSSGK
ncbi:MAX gene-associated protein isoform X3 [Onychomys torridus]|uniref:MAX gene-associated protein isoform X3 n=1 Tax=Onychomys torridus TaxID=38674 RepID=UPI00167FA0AA|nr:MAX gene-associated protein isoform X3 [Onychomys torridus]